MTNQLIRSHEAMMIRRLCELYMVVDAERQKPGNANKGVPAGATKVTTMKDSQGVAAIFRSAGSDRPRSKRSSERREQIPPR